MAWFRSGGGAAFAAAVAFALFGCNSKEPTRAAEVEAEPSAAATPTPRAEPTDIARAQALSLLYPDLGPCPDDGPRLPLSRICAAEAEAYIRSADSVSPAAPQGCRWEVKELPFAVEVLFYRALTCGEATTTLAYAGGAHMAELSYTASALRGEDVLDEVVVRVFADIETAPDFRMRASMVGIEGVDPALCEIRPAGEGYPQNALVIAARGDTPGVECGPNAVSDEFDNFWIRAHDHVFAFTLPRGPRDFDPASLTPVTPL